MSGAETVLAFAATWIAALMLPTSVRGRGMVLLLLTGISVLLSVGWSLVASGWLTRWKSVSRKATARQTSRLWKPNRAGLKFSDRFECKYDGTVYAEPEPRLFSFNNPYGACPTCQGFGNTIGLDLDLVIPNPGLSLKDGAIEPWTKPQHEWAMDELKQFCKSEKISMTVPFAQLSRAEQKAIIEGKRGWGGVRGFFDWLETKKYKLHVDRGAAEGLARWRPAPAGSRPQRDRCRAGSCATRRGTSSRGRRREARRLPCLRPGLLHEFGLHASSATAATVQFGAFVRYGSVGPG